MRLSERLNRLDERVLGPPGPRVSGPRRTRLIAAGALGLIALGVGLPVGLTTGQWFWLIEFVGLSLVVFVSAGRRNSG